MNTDYLQQIKNRNGWFWDCNNTYYLCVTDDLDSLLSALLILMYRPNWKIGFFFDYREGLYKKLDEDVCIDDDNVIFVDCSVPIQGVKCISNHLTSIDGTIHNISDINLNTLDGNSRDKHYFSKYNLSTFLLVCALLDHQINNIPGQVLSLCFDGAFKAYYQPNQYADARVQKRYLCDVLEFEKIYNVQSTISKNKFMQIVEDLNLASKVWVTDEGIECKEYVDLDMICKYLGIDTNLDILDGNFGIVERSTIAYKSIDHMRDKDISKLTSFAVTSRDNCSFSYKI